MVRRCSQIQSVKTTEQLGDGIACLLIVHKLGRNLTRATYIINTVSTASDEVGRVACSLTSVQVTPPLSNI